LPGIIDTGGRINPRAESILIDFHIKGNIRGCSPANPETWVSLINPRALPASQKEFAGGVGIS
jgi:hypothetical protein